MASHLSVKALFREVPRGGNGDNFSSTAFGSQDLSDCHQTLHDHLVCHFNRIIMDRSDSRLKQFTSSKNAIKIVPSIFHDQQEKSVVNQSIALLFELIKCCLLEKEPVKFDST